MRVISRKAIGEYGKIYADSVPSLSNWLHIARKAAWRNFTELRADFGSADQVGRRTVFNIGGNKYRLVARVNFRTQRIFILRDHEAHRIRERGMEIMPVRARRKAVDPEIYARLVAASLPIPPRNESDNERLVALLTSMDERADLTPEQEIFAELLAIVVEDFEDKHYALPAVPAHEALKSLMEDRGLRHKDVWPVVGNKGLTSEILAGRRKISSAVAKRLAAHLHVPLELFV